MLVVAEDEAEQAVFVVVVNHGMAPFVMDCYLDYTIVSFVLPQSH